MFEIADVVIIEGGLFVISDFDPEGFWEDSEATYACRPLVSTCSFTDHDRSVGLPGCTLIDESSWTEPADLDEEVYGTLVLYWETFFFPARAEKAFERVGALRAEKLADSETALHKMLFDGGLARLTEEDNLLRDSIKSWVMEVFGSFTLWRVKR